MVAWSITSAEARRTSRRGRNTSSSIRRIDQVLTKESIVTMTLNLRRMIFLMCVTLAAVVFGTVHAQEVPLATGEHWTKSSEDVKKAYLIGITNIVHVELAHQGTNQAADTQSILPRLVKGLKGQTLDSVREALNKWYAANPKQLQRPVIETLWFEIVLPGLKKTP
jgi:hypothetical protein